MENNGGRLLDNELINSDNEIIGLYKFMVLPLINRYIIKL